MKNAQDYIRIIQKLYTEPLMITPDAHAAISKTFDAYLSGELLQPKEGFLSEFEQEEPEMVVVQNVGIIAIQGPISRKISALERGCGAMGVEDVQTLVQQGLDDSQVGAMVLRVDSPGGTAIGTQEVARFIQDAARVKPIIAHADGIMASAAYKLSAGASLIYASESSFVGSIGTYMAMLDTSRQAELEGKKVELFKAGRLKAAGFPGTSLSAEQREQMQALVDELGKQFTDFVNEAREAGNIDPETMQGQVFTARDAQSRGLVDSIATFEQAVTDAQKLGGQKRQ